MWCRDRNGGFSLATYKRNDEETPSGGAYSEIYYFDDDGNPADEEEATRCVIRECDKNGNLLNEVWGTV